MRGSILIACGGAAARMVSGVSGRVGMDIVYVNADKTIEKTEDGLQILVRPIEETMEEKHSGLVESMRGFRVAVILVALGGTSGSAIVPYIIDYAREAGCIPITVLTVPFGQEQDRRDTAFRVMRNLIPRSDRTVLFDLQTLVENESTRKVNQVMNVSSNVLAFMLKNIADLSEGPILSTLSRHIYTYSYTTGLDPADAVGRALDGGVFPTDTEAGMPVVMVSSGYNDYEIQQITNAVVDRIGSLPDFVYRKDQDDTRVLVFLPVVAVTSSPTASRDG
ncbi:MAG: hypothetical protein IJ856_04815 [Candidatus Methanomethylophilaceae archaeon]|nr:hypothetical protein [Candidatus Methanomethylophilaceae archaeon]